MDNFDTNKLLQNNEVNSEKCNCDQAFGVSDDEIFRIWECVATFISRNMLNQKGVHIPNFGTFSFVQKKLDVGNSKFLLIQRPVFQLSEKICQLHGVLQTKQTVNGSVPVVQLNYSTLAIESGFERDKVETCVRDTLSALNRSVATQRNVELLFSGLGRLQFQINRVKFKFFKEFVNTLDNSGTVVRALQKRPNTADSVMTDRPPSRPFSVALPRVNSGGQINGMPTISEADVEILDVTADLEATDAAEKHDERNENSGKATNRPSAPVAMASNYNLAEMVTQRSRLPRVPSSQSNAQENHFTSADEVLRQKDDNKENNDFQLEERRIFNDLQQGRSDAEMPTNRNDSPGDKKELFPEQNSQRSSALPVPRPPTLAADQRPQSTTSSCGHPSTGQELCYFCMQRRRRNIPVSFKEEIKKREIEEDNLLHAYNTMQDKERIVKDQEMLLARRHDAQKVAAFNLGVAEAQKDPNQNDKNFKPSYIFSRRPLTPPRTLKQNALAEQLSHQVETKDAIRSKLKADEAFLERLEQVQLAEDLAAQREQYKKELKGQKDMYRRALSAQLKFKPAQLPDKESDDLVFGKNDITEQRLLEKRRKANEISRAQLDDVSNKKREELLRKLQEQKYEEEVLKRNKEDIVADRAWRYRRQLANRQTLEEDWSQAAVMKRERDAAEKLRNSMPAGLLHEQCDKYHRCCQCRRKLYNGGESSIWCESYYIPGTRYMT